MASALLTVDGTQYKEHRTVTAGMVTERGNARQTGATSKPASKIILVPPWRL